MPVEQNGCKHVADLRCYFPDEHCVEIVKPEGHYIPHFKLRIMKRLTARRESAPVCLNLSAYSIADYRSLSVLASSWFSSLVSNNGYLLLKLRMPAEEFELYDELEVVHWDSRWTVNGAVCKTELQFWISTKYPRMSIELRQSSTL